MLSVFSVSDAMTDNARSRAVYAVGDPIMAEKINLNLTPENIGRSSIAYDAVNVKYKCTSKGLYLFSFSIGANDSRPVQVHLKGLDKQFALISTSSKHDGIITLSRAVLMPCEADTRVHLYLLNGTVVNYESYRLISFSAFPYIPRYVIPAAWSLLKDYNCDTGHGLLDPFYFNIIAYNENGLWDSGTRKVTIKSSGYYYIYLSTGAYENFPVNMNIQRNGQILFSLSHRSGLADIESFGHGANVILKANDILKVVAEIPTHSYSTETGHESSFFGILLYGI
jgi:hypothetical protein